MYLLHRLFAVGLLVVGWPAAGRSAGPAVPAARAFLDTLTAEQRAAAVFDFTNSAQRIRWSNLPEGMYARAGLRTGTLTASQREALHHLLACTLSAEGQRKVDEIVAGDEICAHRPGGRPTEGTNYYFVSFLGEPSQTNLWTLQFGGHHLAVNATFRGTDLQLTPTFTGVNPASWIGAGAAVIRPLGDEYDLGFAFLRVARRRAAGGRRHRPRALPTWSSARARNGVALVPEGIRGSALNAGPQAALLNLVGEWVTMASEPAAAARSPNAPPASATPTSRGRGPPPTAASATTACRGRGWCWNSPRSRNTHQPHPRHVPRPRQRLRQDLVALMLRGALMLILASGAAAHAHRLDEGPGQAALIRVERDHVGCSST